MADVKRYELFGTFSRMEGCSEGDWVRHTDYAKLRAVAEEMREALKYALINIEGCES